MNKVVRRLQISCCIMTAFIADANECGEGEYRCPFQDTNYCISASQRCNGVQDCSFGHDEVNCGKKFCSYSEHIL
jgi:hypothetical protein